MSNCGVINEKYLNTDEKALCSLCLTTLTFDIGAQMPHYSSVNQQRFKCLIILTIDLHYIIYLPWIF